jgi:hypothetical protein
MLGAIAVGFSQILGPAYGLVYRDTSAVYRPAWWAIRTALAAGDWPVLTHWSGSGVPLERSMAAAPYTPLAAILWFADFDVAYDLFVVAHFVMLALGCYGLCRALGVSQPGSCLAAVAATLCGPTVASENLLVALQFASVIPLTLWAWVSTLRKPGASSAARLALCLGLQLQGFMPELALAEIGAAALLVAREREHATARWAMAAIAAGLLGVAMAAVDWYPAAVGFGETRRGLGFDYAEASEWHLSGLRLIDIVAAGFWTYPAQPRVGLPAAVSSQTSAYLTTIYFGSTLALIPAILAEARRNQTARVLGVAGLLWVALALGPATPLHEALVSLPVFRSTRFPIKFLWCFGGTLSWLLIWGLRGAVRRPRLLLMGGLGYATTILSVLYTTRTTEWRAWFESAFRTNDDFPPIVGVTPGELIDDAVNHGSTRLFWGLGSALGVILISLVLRRARRRGQWALVLWVALDLALATRAVVQGVDVGEGRLPPSARSFIGNEGHRLLVSTPGGARPEVTIEPRSTGFDASYRSMLRRGEHALDGVRYGHDVDVDGQSNPISVLGFGLLRHATTSQAMNLLGRLGYGTLSTPLAPASDVAIAADGTRAALRVEIPDGAPQYFVRLERRRPYVAAYDQWQPIDSALRARARDLASWAGDGENWRRILIHVDAQTPSDVVSHLSALGSEPCHTPPDVSGGILAQRRASVEVTSACPTIVMLLEKRHRGWEATVDGAPSPVLDAEFGFVSTLVPAGTHKVEFQYVSDTERVLPLSATAFLLSLTLAVGAPLVGRRRAR